MAESQKKRQSRLAEIKRTISQKRIFSQNELLRLLNDKGFDVTQATLSRDLRALKVVKSPSSDGRYFYSVAEGGDETSPLISDFLRGFKSVAVSNNIAVIKTDSGFTNVVSIVLDTLMSDIILGTVAGNDNCVMACLRENTTKQQFFDALKDAIPQLKFDN